MNKFHKPSSLYNSIAKDSIAHSETNDCAVKAVSIVTGKPYDQVHAIFENLGRKKGEGSNLYQIKESVNYFGFSYEYVRLEKLQELRKSYHNYNVKRLTLKQSLMFPENWKEHFHGKYLLYTRCHVTACVDGVIHDHMYGLQAEIICAWKIV